MLSRNEWDPLKTVVVGIADDAKIPDLDISLRTINYADYKDESTIPYGSYPQQVIDEANEDLDTLSNFLSNEGVNVLRPDKNIVPNYYNYCPRDTVLVTDDLILATPTALVARRNEWKASERNLNQFNKITVANNPNSNGLYNTDCISNPNILSLNDTEPCFDAANILRANDDLYYLVSNTGNKAGAEYLQSLLPDKKIHLLEGIYSYIHIDSTIAFLREGLMLLNPARIKSIDQLPGDLQDWEVIWAPEPVDIGYYSGYCNASIWVSINLFSVNPNLVVLEEHQHNLRKKLEKHNIECAMLPMRHARTLGGCFHCVTLDIERKREF